MLSKVSFSILYEGKLNVCMRAMLMSFQGMFSKYSLLLLLEELLTFGKSTEPPLSDEYIDNLFATYEMNTKTAIATLRSTDSYKSGSTL